VAESEFARRAARAVELSREPGASTELLGFAAALFRVQDRLATAMASQQALQPLTGRFGTDADRVLHLLPSFLAGFVTASPPDLAEDAARRSAELPDVARQRLLTAWEKEGATEDFLSRAFLRPYVTTLLASGIDVGRRHLPGHCPRCGGAPTLSVRRPATESEALARYLLCGFCGEEWPYVRIKCPSCFEEDPRKLPSFQSERHPGVRIEACDSCHRYLKSLDLGIDARPVPEVDDLASIAIDLWAEEEGYVRLEPGIAGI